MILFINASTLSATGATQVAVSFINECKKFHQHVYHVFLSKTVASHINQKSFPSNFTFYEIEWHPKHIYKGRSTRKMLRNYEKEINPDCVFSVFGPSFWTPTKPHLMGYAYPHYIYPESPYFKIAPAKDRLIVFLYKLIHRFFLKRNGKYYVSETEDVSDRVKKYLNLKDENFFTVTNTYNAFFNNFIPHTKYFLPTKNDNEFRFLTLSSFSIHKNLTILNQVIPLLNKSGHKIDIKFILTINKTIYEEKFSPEAKKSIINLDRIPVDKCPDLYYEVDALFLPTLLECFSANYPEAMKMRKPILTSNLSFARGICEEAAIYFEPLNASDIVEKILMLINNESLRLELIRKGTQQLQKYDSSDDRAKKYLFICENISNS